MEALGEDFIQNPSGFTPEPEAGHVEEIRLFGGGGGLRPGLWGFGVDGVLRGQVRRRGGVLRLVRGRVQALLGRLPRGRQGGNSIEHFLA